MILTKTKIINFIIIVCLYFAAIFGLNETLNPIALYFFIPLAFVISFLRSGFKVNNSLKLLILLYLWIAFTCFFAYDKELAMRELRQVLGCFLLSFIISQNTKYETMTPWLFGVYIVLFIAAIYYCTTHIIDSNFSIGSDRVNDSNINANTLAYYLLFTITSTFFLTDMVKKVFWKNLFRALFWLMFPIAFWVAIFTASRQVLVTSMPLLFMLTYVRYFRNKGSKAFWLFFVIAIAVIASAPKILSIYENSYLKQRNELDIYEDSRLALLVDAFHVGMEHPWVGVGPGNYIAFSYNQHFSHCTYTELFANTGILGALLYITMMVRYMRQQRNWFRKTKDDFFIASLLWGFIYIIYNFLYSFYENLWLISYYVLVASYTKHYYESKHGNMLCFNSN